MRERIGQSDVSDETLQAFFDGELSPEESAAVERAIDEHPELREELARLVSQWGLMRGLVSHGLMREASRVPQARFEQIWDEIDRAIAREDGEAAKQPISIWSRLFAAARPLRWPAVAAAAAAVLTLVVVQSGPQDPRDETNIEQPAVVEREAPPPTMSPPDLQPDPKTDDRLAVRPPISQKSDDADFAPMPVPEAAEVEIHNVDFGGKSGGVSISGTTVVLYVAEEEVGSADSERSL